MWKAALPSCQNIGQCLLRVPWAEFWRVVPTWSRRACLWPSSIRFQIWAYYLAARIQNLRAQSSIFLTGGEPGQTDQGWMAWHVTFGRLFIVPTSLSEVNPNLLTYQLVQFPGLSSVALELCTGIHFHGQQLPDPVQKERPIWYCCRKWKWRFICHISNLGLLQKLLMLQAWTNLSLTIYPTTRYQK